MLPDLTLPPSLMALLAVFQPCFTAPSFRAFCGLTAGFVAQPGRRTTRLPLILCAASRCGLVRIWKLRAVLTLTTPSVINKASANAVRAGAANVPIQLALGITAERIAAAETTATPVAKAMA